MTLGRKQVIKVKWGPKGGAHDGIRRDSRELALSLSTEKSGCGDSVRRCCLQPKEGLSPDTEPAGTLILDLQGSRAV